MTVRRCAGAGCTQSEVVGCVIVWMKIGRCLHVAAVVVMVAGVGGGVGTMGEVLMGC